MLLKGVNLYLIGMMGAGKSTIGRLLAQEFHYQFFDTDQVIEQVAGCSISTIFATEGETAFRDLETQVLAELSSRTQLVIATGGGIVVRPQNWSYLHHGLVVWLDVSVELLYHRLRYDTTRPLLKTADPLQQLTNLWRQREQFYAQADVRVPITQEQVPEKIAQQVISQIKTVLRPEGELINGNGLSQQNGPITGE